MIAEQLTVRRIGPADDAAPAENLLVRFFREEAFTTPDDVIRQRCRILRDLETCALFVAETSAGPAGVATVSMQYGIEFGWLGEMGDLYVVPACRGQGIAQALVAAVEEFLRKRAAAGYQVTVVPHSRQAFRLTDFYRKLGFSEKGREILYRRF